MWRESKLWPAAPAQAEAKFDQGKGGAIVDAIPDVADKLNDIADKLKEIGGVAGGAAGGLGIAAIQLRDLGVIGHLAADESGGNEATRQMEAKLDAA